MTEEERKAAWEDFENEKTRPPPAPFPNWPMQGTTGDNRLQLALEPFALDIRTPKRRSTDLAKILVLEIPFFIDHAGFSQVYAHL